MEERNQNELSENQRGVHLGLNILDIINFIGKVKLEYLGDDVATEIVTSYNDNVDEMFQITTAMSGNEIREIFQKLPNNVKTLMKNKIVIDGFVSKDFFNNLIKASTEERDFFLRDDEIKGSLINMFSIVMIIACILMFYVYNTTESYRDPLGDTVASKVFNVVIQYIEEKIQ